MYGCIYDPTGDTTEGYTAICAISSLVHQASAGSVSCVVHLVLFCHLAALMRLDSLSLQFSASPQSVSVLKSVLLGPVPDYFVCITVQSLLKDLFCNMIK